MMESICTVTRNRISRDSAQGTTQPSEVVLVLDEPCSIQPAGTAVETLYAQRETKVNTRIFFTRNIGAQVNDKVEAYDKDGTLHRFNVEGFARNLFGRFLSPYFIDCNEIAQVGSTE